MKWCRSSLQTSRSASAVAFLAVSVTALGVGVAMKPAMGAEAPEYRQQPRTDIVQTEEGPVRGFKNDGVDVFLGIPFAAPPVGDLRWKPPQKVASWSNTLDAVKFEKTCMQTNTLGVFAAASDKEDCLYLNVFARSKGRSGNRNGARPKPVMVWIYGGGLFDGSSNEYDGSKLARDGDVVFVSMNYRQNVLGFLSHPALDAGADSHTNYGIMDMQAALRWVQRNIGSFGGDPQNVTIFGESAGGTAVLFNMVSPGAKGLFHRAIMLSPQYVASQASYAEGVARGVEFAAAVGCGSDASPATAACLRAVPIEKIMATRFPGMGPVRAVDGKVLPINMGEAFVSGNFNKVPALLGSTRDEFTWGVGLIELETREALTAEKYPAAAARLFGPKNGPRVLAQYPVERYPTPSHAFAAAWSHQVMSCATRRVARILVQHVPAYTYMFGDRTAPVYFPAASFTYGAAHTLELQYLFANFHGATGEIKPLNSAQRKLSDEMVSYWTTFARAGNPNSPSTPNWALFDPKRDNYQLLDLPRSTGAQQFAPIHKCDFWDSIDGS